MSGTDHAVHRTSRSPPRPRDLSCRPCSSTGLEVVARGRDRNAPATPTGRSPLPARAASERLALALRVTTGPNTAKGSWQEADLHRAIVTQTAVRIPPSLWMGTSIRAAATHACPAVMTMPQLCRQPPSCNATAGNILTRLATQPQPHPLHRRAAWPRLRLTAARAGEGDHDPPLGPSQQLAWLSPLPHTLSTGPNTSCLAAHPTR